MFSIKYLLKMLVMTFIAGKKRKKERNRFVSIVSKRKRARKVFFGRHQGQLRVSFGTEKFLVEKDDETGEMKDTYMKVTRMGQCRDGRIGEGVRNWDGASV